LDKTFVHRNEECVPERKISKDRVIFMPCANSTSTHKLQLMVVREAKHPRTFKKVSSLPVVYKNQTKGWVTREVFLDWFNEHFIPKQNLPVKALLILDNAPKHPNEGQLKSANGLIQVMFMPSNCTPPIQPMNQNVIRQIKSHYKKSLLLNIINQNEDVHQFLKSQNLKT